MDCLISFGYFVVALLCLAFILKHYYLDSNKLRRINDKDAIIITGCDSGIGLQLVKYFFRISNFKIICCFLHPNNGLGYKELRKLAESDHDRRLIFEKLDVTEERDVQNLVGSICRMKKDHVLDNLMALINNAGVMCFGEFDWLTWDQIQRQVDVNLLGTLRITRALLPHIIESKGRVINVTSVADTTVYPGVSVYSATKSALVTFSKGLGYELRKFGAHVVTMRLGDYANLTNIMASHSTDKANMWDSFEASKKQMYKEYFQQFHKHVVENRGMIGPNTFEDSPLFRDFHRAVYMKSPPTTIVSASFSFRLAISILDISPIWVQYLILDLFLKSFFQMKTPAVIKQTL